MYIKILKENKILLGQMLEALYKFVIRYGKPVEFIVKSLANFGIKILSKLKQFKAPPHGNSAFRYHILLGTYELETVLFCKRFLRQGMTALDVGAHIGYYSCFFSRLVEPHGKVYAFEPHPDNFEIMKYNTQKFRNVFPIQMAVVDKEMETVLYESSIGKLRHSLLASRGPYVRQISVKGISLDNFFKNEKVDLIKIDVEGVELEVLIGAQELISRSERLGLIIEFNPDILVKRGLEPLQFLDIIARLGLDIYVIKGPSGALIPLDPWGKNNGKFISSISKYVNLYAYKK